jgi:kinesin family member 2/24
MDRFYLQNAALYKRLLSNIDASKPKAHFSRHTAGSSTEDQVREQSNSDMIVAARIRPILEEDLNAGFPCAVYPRTSAREDGPQIVDLHDLYNHPRGRPEIRVCRNSSRTRVSRIC